ncbi:MAG: GNAT family N-acetyltransferase [Hyphomicrobiaceae bacterium]
MLTTARLTLRPFTYGDAPAFQMLAGDWDVARMTSDIPHPLDAVRARHWLQPATGEQRFAICRKGVLIGGVGTFRRESGLGELGFWLGHAWWGQGFATEAARAVLTHGLETSAYTGYSSSYFDDNPASRRVLEKLGFAPAGTGTIWSEARRATVGAQWVWMSLERATELHLTPHPQAPALPQRRWGAILDRLPRFG